MKRVICAVLCIFLALGLCACEPKPAFVNPVATDPNYITFMHENFSISYPASYNEQEKEGYLLYGCADADGKQVFGVTAETATLEDAGSVTNSVVEKLCQSIIESSLPSYSSAAEHYDAQVSAEDFSYTVDSIEYPVYGAKYGAKACYTINFQNEAFAPVSMSFCNIWVFDEETMYVVTFCDVTGASAQASFAACADYIFCK